jgi:hypothetical protein
MKNGKFKGNTSQWPSPCGVPMNNSLCIEFRAIGIRGTYDYNQVVLAMFINNLFDTLLTIQVNSTSCCSNKALGLDQQWLSPSALYTCCNGLPLYPIPLAKNNNFLTFQLHLHYLLFQMNASRS